MVGEDWWSGGAWREEGAPGPDRDSNAPRVPSASGVQNRRTTAHLVDARRLGLGGGHHRARCGGGSRGSNARADASRVRRRACRSAVNARDRPLGRNDVDRGRRGRCCTQKKCRDVCSTAGGSSAGRALSTMRGGVALAGAALFALLVLGSSTTFEEDLDAPADVAWSHPMATPRTAPPASSARALHRRRPRGGRAARGHGRRQRRPHVPRRLRQVAPSRRRPRAPSRRAHLRGGSRGRTRHRPLLSPRARARRSRPSRRRLPGREPPPPPPTRTPPHPARVASSPRTAPAASTARSTPARGTSTTPPRSPPTRTFASRKRSSPPSSPAATARAPSPSASSASSPRTTATEPAKCPSCSASKTPRDRRRRPRGHPRAPRDLARPRRRAIPPRGFVLRRGDARARGVHMHAQGVVDGTLEPTRAWHGGFAIAVEDASSQSRSRSNASSSPRVASSRQRVRPGERRGRVETVGRVRTHRRARRR